MSVSYFGHGDAKERFTFWLENPPSAIAIDVETVSLKDRDPMGFAVAFSPDEAFYFDVSHDIPRELELVKPLLSNAMIIKAGHNLMFDLSVFPLIPVVGEVIERSKLFDTNVAARVLGYIETSLPIIAPEFGKYTTPMAIILKDNNCKDNSELVEKNPAALADHCAHDAMATYQLYLEFREPIEKDYSSYFSIEMQALPIVLDMSLHGLKIDQAKRAELAAEYQKDIDFYGDYIRSFGIENPNSSQQVGYTLAERGSFLRFTKSRKQYSTRESELEFLSDPLAAAILNYRHKFKFKSTYLDPLEGEDRFFTEYYFDTSVGRLNSRNRNIQNIPVTARSMIVPDSGVFTTGDYGREHLYLLAHMSEDKDMLRVLYSEDRREADIHQHTADKMGVPRPLAKTLNFAVAYGATAQTVRDQAKIRDMRRCQALIDDWFKAYRGVADWVHYAQKEGMKDRKSLPTLFGRRITIPEELTRNGTLNRDSMERKCVNYPILGCVPSDSRILTRRNGYIPISNIAVDTQEEIWDGERFVRARVAYSGKKQLVRINLANGQALGCSPEHKWLVENSRRSRSWKTPKELKKQDNICVSEPMENNNLVIPFAPLTTHRKATRGIGNTIQQSFSAIKDQFKLGFTLGRLASDGWYSPNSRTLRWIIAEHELPVLDYLKDALSPFKHKVIEVSRKGRSAFGYNADMTLYYIDIYSVQLAKQAQSMMIGRGIPFQLWSSSTALRGFLSGLFDGDGSVSDTPTLTIGGSIWDSSYPEEVQQALLVLGIRSTIRRYSSTSYNPIAKVRVRAKDVPRFISEIGFVSPKKNFMVAQTDSLYSLRFSRHTERVRSVTFTQETVDMYDIVDSESGRFMTEGYITHNSDGEVIKRAFILCNNRGLGPPLMAITVHDSITWDGAVADKIPVRELEAIPGFRVPFEVKQTRRWE